MCQCIKCDRLKILVCDPAFPAGQHIISIIAWSTSKSHKSPAVNIIICPEVEYEDNWRMCCLRCVPDPQLGPQNWSWQLSFDVVPPGGRWLHTVRTYSTYNIAATRTGAMTSLCVTCPAAVHRPRRTPPVNNNAWVQHHLVRYRLVGPYPMLCSKPMEDQVSGFIAPKRTMRPTWTDCSKRVDRLLPLLQIRLKLQATQLQDLLDRSTWHRRPSQKTRRARQSEVAER